MDLSGNELVAFNNRILEPVILLLEAALAVGLGWLVGRLVKGSWRWVAAAVLGATVPPAVAFVAIRKIAYPAFCAPPCDDPFNVLGTLGGVALVVLLPIGIAASIASVIIQDGREGR